MRTISSVAHTDTMTLETVIARLAAHDVVDGILLLGSTARGALTPTSDYDLLLVLDEPPAPLRIVNTWIDGRLSEVYCTTVRALERIMAPPTAWPDMGEEGIVVNWLRNGRIAHDRAGRLGRALEAARATPTPTLPDECEVYSAWRTIGYNAAQLRRYLASDDPVAGEAVDLRLLYSLSEVVVHYFTVRRLPWRGEKSALRYLAAHDPGYLARLRECLAETNRRRKVERYEELARQTLAPVGGLWGVGMTVVAPGAGYGAGTETEAGSVEDALAFWQRLVAPRVDERGTIDRFDKPTGHPPSGVMQG